jgi:hypothetical protein
MRKLIVLLALALLAVPLFGQTEYLSDATIVWDPSPGLEDGTPFEPADFVEYEVVRQDKNGGPIEQLGTTDNLAFYTVLPNDRVKYVYAVRTKLTTDEGQTVLYSEYVVSPFDLRHPSTIAPAVPGVIRIE